MKTKTKGEITAPFKLIIDYGSRDIYTRLFESKEAAEECIINEYAAEYMNIQANPEELEDWEKDLNLAIETKNISKITSILYDNCSVNIYVI